MARVEARDGFGVTFKSVHGLLLLGLAVPLVHLDAAHVGAGHQVVESADILDVSDEVVRIGEVVVLANRCEYVLLN